MSYEEVYSNLHNSLIINVLRVRGLEPRKPPEPKSGILPLNYTLLLVLATTRRTPKPVHNLGKLYISIGLISIKLKCYFWACVSLAQAVRCLPRFIRRCTSSSPWIHIYWLRTCITLPKLDNANHELLIAIVHPIQVRTWCSISCLTSVRRMIVLLLLYYQNREAQVLPTKVTSYCEPHKQSTHYFQVLISWFS